MTARRALLAASLVAGLVAGLIAVSGGTVVSVGGVRVSARTWQGAALAALAAGSLWAWLAVRSGTVVADLASTETRVHARARLLVGGLAVVTVVQAAVFATYSASGADASGYVSQAAMWSRGEVRLRDPLVDVSGWPLEPGDTAPLGWRPARAHGWQVPTYAPGLPWLMAVPHAAAGMAGAMAVVIGAAGLVVWAAGSLGARLGGPVAALVAALLVATSPTFLLHAFQPMSDVPVTAAWALCWLAVSHGRTWSAGVAAAVAVLVRPNLAPLAALPAVAIWWRGADRGAIPAAAAAGVPVVLAGSLVAVLQWYWYGSPVQSGYGSAGELFALGNVGPNLRLYASWLWEAEPVFALAMLPAAWVAAGVRRNGHRLYNCHRDCPHLAVFAGGVVGAYLVYAQFEVWSYLRFVLPALLVVAVLGGVALAGVSRRLPVGPRAVLLLAALAGVAASGVSHARGLGVFGIAARQARAPEAAEALAARLPAHAVLLTGEQSGSMRYYTGRPIVRWEPLDVRTLAATIAALEAAGYEPWWVLDQFEEASVRARFSTIPAGALDWAPAIEAGPVMRTRAWRVADREAH